MSFILANFLGAAEQNGAFAKDSPEAKRELIERVCAKMTDSAHLEDRRAAAQTLKSLAHSHQLEIGTFGLQALVEELRRDSEDEETAKVVLETLNVLFSPAAEEEDAGIEVQFCEIFLKKVENVQLLLDRLGEDNFYLRFTSIQLLTALAQALPTQLQSAILASPSGATKILELLRDEREIVRNEGILLLQKLVNSNADLQKVVAFQGAFEQLMQIVVEEGGAWEGPSVVGDALFLIAQLLEFNTANQMYFRDCVCFKQLAGLLGLPDDESHRELWNRNRSGNFEAALTVLGKLINRDNVDLEQAQNLMLNAHYLHPLLMLAFDSKIPFKVAAKALETLAGLIWRNQRAQAAFSNAKLTRIPVSVPSVTLPCSPLLATTLVALNGNVQEGHEMRLKALDCFEAYCSGNSEAQLAILSTLNPPPGATDNSIGSAIAEALLDLDLARKRDPWHIWMASQLLAYCVADNPTAKQKLLLHSLGEDEESLLNFIMLNLIRISRDSRSASYENSVVGYLVLIACLLEDFTAGVGAFLKEGSFVQYLIERVTQASSGFDVEIQGLAAIILGFLVIYNDDSSTSFTSESIKGLIKNRIGPDLYISRLLRFRQQPSAICKKEFQVDNLTKLVGKPTPAGTSASQTATLHKELAACRALLAETQNSHAQALKAAETFKIGIAERDAYITQLQKMISDKNQRIAQLAHDLSLTEQSLVQVQLTAGNGTKNGSNEALEAQNELLTEQVNQYYQQYLADQAAIEALNQTIVSIQETLQKQQKRIEELEAQLQSSQSPNEELEAWKQAYHELYAQFSEFSTNSVSEPVEPIESIESIESIAEPIEPELLVQNSLQTTAQNVIQPPIKEHITQYPIVEVSNHETLSEIAEQVAQVVLESPVVDSKEDVMILSPSQFMSPLESSSPKSGSVEELSMSDFESQPSEELPMIANPLPNPEASNFYPSLPAAEVTVKPATIISTEQSQPSEQEEASETIQLQPSNPLPNPNVAFVEDAYPQLPPQPDIQRRASVSSPETQTAQMEEPAEIDQVLEFFEKLPEAQDASSVVEEAANASFEMPSEFEAEVQEIEQISETLPEVYEQAVHEGHITCNEYESQQYEGHDSQQYQGYQSQQYQEYDQSQTYANYNQTQQYEEGQYDQSYNEHSNETDHFEQHFNQVCDDNQKFEQEYAAVEPVSETQNTYEVQQEEYSQDAVYTQQAQVEQYGEQYNEQQWEYSEQPTEQYAELSTEQYTEPEQSTEQYAEQQFEEYSEQQQNQCSEEYAGQKQDQYSEQQEQQEQSTDYTDTYYDESTNCSYGFDPSCNQYYYYNHTTGESQYYVPEEQQQQMYATEEVASNPSIPQDHGPPLVQLQATSSEAHQTREADHVYSI